ncbi:MAG: hypothetical protein PHI06_14725 [Desulfobulbaceae bacterium]|nr:hypothetical protein [Desulfobulbaceae bacterium]
MIILFVFEIILLTGKLCCLGNVADVIISEDEQEVNIVNKKIQWEAELAQALQRSKAEMKPILLDFHNPH